MPLRTLVLFALVALATACSSPDEVREKTGVAAGGSQASAHANAAASDTASGTKVKEDTDLYSFEFSYPGQVTAYPQLAAHLD